MPLSRDENILDVVRNAYSFQYDLREKLDSKLNNFAMIASTITALNAGIAFVVFDKIPRDNPYYSVLAITFTVGTSFFVISVIVGLHGYRPAVYALYPEDPERLIQEYKNLSESEVVRMVASSFAKAANSNKAINAEKSRTLKRMFWLLLLGIIMLIIFTTLTVAALNVSTVIGA